ncbi:NADH dehydrogenase [ubiquinone] 1 beta subcomplex subunit 5, mitochondrial [Apis florea]|uniref:NADH dehydrogenase [ubiquinone] 1 beta subcomplex subunit 5, mitochondrial n=1 Tax=Apis florea TaxID=7463 RepID=UPI000252B9A4|nr:NADH dehydrogenase [ubiquinone] 1 beta subcomplex subunit 5, mitochondrial [Apis florea]
MVVLSRLLFARNQKIFHINGLLNKLIQKNNNNYTFQNQGALRWMSEHRTMNITPSRWQWHKTKDWMHFYFFVGAIPAGLIIFFTNVFIGPAQLEPIPDGYSPKQWEYYSHPISRFLSKYFFPNEQMEYEKLLHKLTVANNKRLLFKLEKQIRELEMKHNDYKYWSYRQGSASQIINLRKKIDERDPNVIGS